MKRASAQVGGPLATVNSKRQIVVQENLHLEQVDPIDLTQLGRETRVISADVNSEFPSFHFETGTNWVDLSGGKLCFKFSVVKGDGGNLTDGLNLAPRNNFGMTIFRLVEFEINEKSLTNVSNRALPHLGYILHLLNYDQDDMNTFLPLQGWEKDITGSFDVIDVTAANTGYNARHALINQSNITYIEVPLKQFPMLALDKPLPPNSRVKLAFRLNEPQYCLQGDGAVGEVMACKLRLQKVKLHVDNLVLAPAFEAELNRRVVDKSFVVNDIDSWDVKTLLIPNGGLEPELTNVFQGLLPKRVILFLQPTNRLNGHFARNIFRYQRHYLDKIEVSGSLGKMELDMSDGKDVVGYKTLIKVREDHGKGCTITLADWKADYCFYILDFTPHGDYYDTVRSIDTHGNLDFKFTFQATHAPNGLKAVFMGQKNNTIMMDSTQSVLSEIQ